MKLTIRITQTNLKDGTLLFVGKMYNDEGKFITQSSSKKAANLMDGLIPYVERGFDESE